MGAESSKPASASATATTLVRSTTSGSRAGIEQSIPSSTAKASSDEARSSDKLSTARTSTAAVKTSTILSASKAITTTQRPVSTTQGFAANTAAVNTAVETIDSLAGQAPGTIASTSPSFVTGTSATSDRLTGATNGFYSAVTGQPATSALAAYTIVTQSGGDVCMITNPVLSPSSSSLANGAANSITPTYAPYIPQTTLPILLGRLDSGTVLTQPITGTPTSASLPNIPLCPSSTSPWPTFDATAAAGEDGGSLKSSGAGQGQDGGLSAGQRGGVAAGIVVAVVLAMVAVVWWLRRRALMGRQGTGAERDIWGWEEQGGVSGGQGGMSVVGGVGGRGMNTVGGQGVGGTGAGAGLAGQGGAGAGPGVGAGHGARPGNGAGWAGAGLAGAGAGLLGAGALAARSARSAQPNNHRGAGGGPGQPQNRSLNPIQTQTQTQPPSRWSSNSWTNNLWGLGALWPGRRTNGSARAGRNGQNADLYDVVGARNTDPSVGAGAGGGVPAIVGHGGRAGGERGGWRRAGDRRSGRGAEPWDSEGHEISAEGLREALYGVQSRGRAFRD